MTRPKLSDPRCEQLNLSLTTAELADIKRRAQAVGMRTAHFGRTLLLDRGATVSVKRETSGNDGRLIYTQLIRIGNNLNQMMRHLHQTGDPVPADLEPLLKDIRQIIARGCGDDR